MSLNPNIPVRVALISLLSGLGIPAWNKRIPKNVAAPSKYALLTSQTKQPTETSKDGYEWMASINVDIYQINPYGYVNTVPIDDLEQSVVNGIEALSVPGWNLKNITLLNIQDLDADTTSQTIERRVISYQFWLDTSTPQPGAAVNIVDQLGNTIAVVQAPGTFEVLKFDTVDLHSIGTTPDIVITQTT